MSRYFHNLIDVRHGEMVGYVSVQEADHAEFYARTRAFATEAVRAYASEVGVGYLTWGSPDRLRMR